MSGHLNIQEDQDEAYLMASFPYLADASAEPDSDYQVRTVQTHSRPSPNTFNSSKCRKTGSEAETILPLNLFSDILAGPEYYFNWNADSHAR
jgi:hypothetical protein